MPQPIVLQDTSGIAEGISQAGSALAKGLQVRGEKAREKQYGTVLNGVLSNLKPDAGPQDYIKAYQELASKTSPDYAQKASTFLQPFIKESLERQTSEREWSDIFGQPSPGQPQGGQPPAGDIPQQQPGAEPAQSVPGQENKLARATDDQLVKMQASKSDTVRRLATAEAKRRESSGKDFSEDRKYHATRTNKTDEEADALRSKLQKKKFAATASRSAIESGNVGPFSLANIANRLQMPELQNLEGGQLALASKINLVGNLADVSARAQNMYMEKIMAQAFPMIGQPKATNRVVQELADAEIEMNQSYLDHYDRISAEDEEKFGFKKNTVKARAEKAAQKDYDQILKKTAYKTSVIQEAENGFDWLKKQSTKKPAKGTPNTKAMTAVFINKHKGNVKKALEEMRKMGYDLVSKQEMEEWD